MHVEKFKITSIGQITAHIERTRAEGHYGNINIDSERTSLNYDIHENTFRRDFTTIRNEVETRTQKALRKDAVVAVGIVVQLPEEYKNINAHDMRDFFENLNAGLTEKFGNCCWSAVHMDEKTPHLHFGFIPYNGEQLRVKNYINRNMLKGFHDEMNSYLKKHLDWYHGGLVAEDPNERLKAKDNLAMNEYKETKALNDRLTTENTQKAQKALELGNDIARQAQINTELKSRSVPPSIIEKVENGKRLKKSERVELLALATKGADSDRILADIDRRRFDNATKEAELNRLHKQIDDIAEQQTEVAQALAKQEQNILNREYMIQARSESLSIKEKALSEREREYNKMAEEVTTLRQRVERLTNGIKAVCRCIFGIGTDEEKRKDYAQARRLAEAFHLVAPMTHHNPKGRGL